MLLNVSQADLSLQEIQDLMENKTRQGHFFTQLLTCYKIRGIRMTIKRERGQGKHFVRAILFLMLHKIIIKKSNFCFSVVTYCKTCILIVLFLLFLYHFLQNRILEYHPNFSTKPHAFDNQDKLGFKSPHECFYMFLKK